MTAYRKKLIEVALPLGAINQAAASENSGQGIPERDNQGRVAVSCG